MKPIVIMADTHRRVREWARGFQKQEFISVAEDDPSWYERLIGLRNPIVILLDGVVPERDVRRLLTSRGAIFVRPD